MVSPIFPASSQRPYPQGLRNRGNDESKKLIGGYKSREWDRNRGAVMQLRKNHTENEEKYDQQVKAWQDMFEEDEEDKGW